MIAKGSHSGNSPLRTLVACAVVGALSVASGGCGLMKRADATDPLSLAGAATVKKFANFLQSQSNMTRSSGDATYIRLQALFPDQLQSKVDYLNPLNMNVPYGSGGWTRTNGVPSQGMAIFSFGSFTGTGAYASFGNPMRPATLEAQAALHDYAQMLCSNDKAGKMFQTDGILMDGESLPSDQSTLLAFAAARNAWLYPYTADSPEVQSLATFYQQALAKETAAITGPSGPALQALGAKQALCLVTLSSSQFWLGGGGKLDPIRRVALEIGRRAPTFKEYSDYLHSNQPLDQWLQAYTQKLQSEAGYEQAVYSWYQQGLDLFLLDNPIIPGDGRAPQYLGSVLGGADAKHSAMMYVMTASTLHAPNASQFPAGLDYVRYNHGAVWAASTEFCDGDITEEQPFDPRTTKILWEQLNPVSQQWEELGAWVRSPTDGTWSLENGSITLADGSKKTVSLSDVTNAHDQQFLAAEQRIADAYPVKGANQYCYSTASALFGTPMQCFHLGAPYGSYTTAGVFDPGYHERRVRRFAVSGEQNGWSTVRFPNNGQPVKACNIQSRYWASCFYRPSGPRLSTLPGDWDAASGGAHVFAVSGNRYVLGPKNPAAGAVLPPWDVLGPTGPIQVAQTAPALDIGGYDGNWNGDTIMIPSILDEMRCMEPDMTKIDTIAVKPVPIKNAPAARAAGQLWTQAQESQADLAVYPKGYPDSDFTCGASGCAVTPLSQITPHLATMVRATFDLRAYNGPHGSGSYPSVADRTTTSDYLLAYRRLQHDVAMEPYRLIQDLIGKGTDGKEKDFRLLVTADYTFVGNELELAYRTQGWDLPTYPPGYTPPESRWLASDGYHISHNPVMSGTPIEPANGFGTATTEYPWDVSSRIHKLSESDIAPIPLSWVQSSFSYQASGGYPWKFALNEVIPAYFDGALSVMPTFFYIQSGRIPPKKMSGILTMLNFLEPAYGSSYKMRTLISRYFNLLLCGDPSTIVLTADQANFQEQYIPQVSHRDRDKGCFQCHVNVDPLASALSTTFTDKTYTGVQILDAFGETVAYPSNNPTVGWAYTDTVSTGAFMGQKVSGVKEVGRAIANSEPFARCTVQTAFQGVYGRAPGFNDVKLIKQVIEKFMTSGNYNYNDMVRDLVATPNFTEGD